MSSGLYVPAADIKYPAPGPGVSTDGRLCSSCNKPSRSEGGGTLDGRWYCAGCKPPRQARPQSNWTNAVHKHCLAAGIGITPAEAEAQFGTPPSNNGVDSILAAAARSGWFRREASRYYAVDRSPPPAKRPDNRSSYFTGMVRCRSIFELGEML